MPGQSLDKNRVLQKVFNTLNFDRSFELIREMKPEWNKKKKPSSKKALKEDFLALADLIGDDQIEDFVEMAVMRKTIGLPAYTYQLKTVPSNVRTYKDYPTGDIYTVSTQILVNDNTIIKVNVRVKEYRDEWRSGAKDLTSLTAVYQADVVVDKETKLVTIHCGNHEINSIIRSFLVNSAKWQMMSYHIPKRTAVGNASFKTAAILDLLYNRLRDRNIASKIIEVKFYTGSKRRRKDSIRHVSMGGDNDVIMSALASEYITLGCDIDSFKTIMTYEGVSFGVNFSLLGEQFDEMKIVVVGTEIKTVRELAMRTIQDEYVDMCNNGIKDMSSTEKLLESIYKIFAERDQVS